MRLSYPRSSMINACPFSFCMFFFLCTFWFHYHFFSGFSTIHLSFMEMVKRHKNFESYFLRHYVSSNHFFLHFFPLFGLQEEKRFLFVFSMVTVNWQMQQYQSVGIHLAEEKIFTVRCPKINWNKKGTNSTRYRKKLLAEFLFKMLYIKKEFPCLSISSV